jgi:hypothetical protein
MSAVRNRLPPNHPLRPALDGPYVNTRTQVMPSDACSDEGLVYRAYNYRHQVTHRRSNPFLYRVGSEPPVSFILDPRVVPLCWFSVKWREGAIR